MKPSEIKVGKTYKSKGAWKSFRKVLAIGDEHKPPIYFNGTGVNSRGKDTGVLFKDTKGRESNLYLSSFAAWCGEEVN